MTEPKRWLDEGAPRDIEHLMRAARGDQPSNASLRRTLTALGVGLGTTSIAPIAAGAGTAAGVGGTLHATAVTGGLLAKWAAFGMVLGTFVAGAATIARLSTPKSEAPAPSVASRAPNPPDAARAAAQNEEHPAARSVAPSAVEPVLSPSGARAASTGVSTGDAPSSEAPARVPSVAAAPDAETLAMEVQSVDGARAALAAGRAAETIARLDEYERRFPTRRFGPEALYLRMEALVALGRTAPARAAAERLLATYPESPNGVRARAVLSKVP